MIFRTSVPCSILVLSCLCGNSALIQPILCIKRGLKPYNSFILFVQVTSPPLFKAKFLGERVEAPVFGREGWGTCVWEGGLRHLCFGEMVEVPVFGRDGWGTCVGEGGLRCLCWRGRVEAPVFGREGWGTCVWERGLRRLCWGGWVEGPVLEREG